MCAMMMKTTSAVSRLLLTVRNSIGDSFPMPTITLFCRPAEPAHRARLALRTCSLAERTPTSCAGPRALLLVRFDTHGDVDVSSIHVDVEEPNRRLPGFMT